MCIHEANERQVEEPHCQASGGLQAVAATEAGLGQPRHQLLAEYSEYRYDRERSNFVKK